MSLDDMTDTVTLPPLVFTSADVPPDDESGPEAGGTADLTCDVCGIPLAYGGRGKKPKTCPEHRPSRQARTGANTGRSPRGSAADVTAALAQMDVLYTLSAGTLLMFQGPEVAGPFSERCEVAQLVNRSAFESDRALARRIAGGAGSVAPLMFLAAQAFVIGPVMRGAYDAARIKTKRTKPAPQHAADGVPFAAFAVNGDGTVS